jgi:hypothetical protein
MTDKAMKPALSDHKPEDDPKRLAQLATSPTVRSAVVGSEYAANLFGEVNQQAYFDYLATSARAVQGGDLDRPKAMLMSQANMLDLIFNSLAQRSANAHYLPQMEAYMRLALKAQAQAARTIKVLGELDNPQQVVFAKQANIAAGPQQVNNCARTEKTNEPANELLEEVNYGHYLDTTTASQTIRGDTALAAVEAVNWPQD